MNSFRLRLALLVGSITAALLLAAGLLAWQITIRFNLDRLDRELRNLGAANLDRVVGDEHWRRVESALRFVSGADRPPGYALWVENYGRTIYRSPHWPENISPASLPKPGPYEGGLTFSTLPPPPRPGEPLSPRNPPLPRREPIFLDASADGHAWRLAVMGTPYTTLVLAADSDDFNASLVRLRHVFLTALPGALLLVGGGAWFLAGRAMRPVRAFSQAAERVTARGLDQRIVAPADDREFQRLVTVFNEMMDRLETSFHQATRFSADASHELKTPLALLQAELEHGLASAPPGSAQQQTCSSLLEEVHRLTAIVEKLLLLSLADAGRLELHLESVDAAPILANVIEDCAALAPHLKVESPVTLPQALVRADIVLLEQALQNLGGNAIKYNRDGGRIRFEIAVEQNRVAISIGNTGPGISAADRVHLFERFHRGDRARRRQPGAGVGLGLSLSREILRAHGGDLTLAPSPDDWTLFIVTLPFASAPPA